MDKKPLNKKPLKKIGEDVVSAEKISKISSREKEPDWDDKRKALDYQNQKQNIKLRKIFSISAGCLLVSWLIFVGATILINFFWGKDFTPISDTVIIAMLTTTTASVISLSLIIIKSLFNEKPKE